MISEAAHESRADVIVAGGKERKAGFFDRLGWRKKPTTIFPSDCLEVPEGVSLLHVTHWKAGSQWIRGILDEAFGPASQTPTADALHVFRSAPKAGAVYPCLYLCKQEFDCISLPKGSRYFVVIRDLRDSLISSYFSLRFSHGVESTFIERHRYALNKMGEEEGLLYLFHSFADRVAMIQRSWLRGGIQCLKAEDFMADPAGRLHALFDELLGVSIDDTRLRQLAERHSFEKLSGGRRPGEEDVNSHYRKGVKGDWRLHFTPRIKDQFKQFYNDVLVRAGYERDDCW